MNEPTGKRRARRGESRGHGCGGGDAGRAEGHDVQVGHHVVVLVLEDGEAGHEGRLGRLAGKAAAVEESLCQSAHTAALTRSAALGNEEEHEGALG